MSAPPVIQSIGIPPDRHSERICDLWLRHLHSERERLWANVEGSLNPKQMGNPIGQQRAVDRFKKAAGDLLLDVTLETGKRGRFSLMFATWVLCDPVDGSFAVPTKPSPFPEGARLGVAIAFYCGRGQQDWSAMLTLIISKHAVIRLAQRSNVRTTGDLLQALRSLWLVMRELILTRKAGWDDPPCGAWRLPLSREDGAPVAVLERDRSAAGRLVVVTILDADMREA